MQPQRKTRYAGRGGWSDAAIEMMKSMADDGHNYADIARELYARFGLDKSRSAVKGRLDRAGYVRRETLTPPGPAARAALVRAVSFGRLPPPRAPDAPGTQVPKGRLLPLAARGCGCAFPTAEAVSGETLYCAEAIGPDARGRPYCAAHLAVMYDAPRKAIRLPGGAPERRTAPARDASFLAKWGAA